MNNTDPPVALAEDQCVLAVNIEWIDSMIAERRMGTRAITLPSFLADRERVPWVFRHLPVADETQSELWVLGLTGETTAVLGRKTSGWVSVSIPDNPVLTGTGPYRWQGLSLHGKLHIAYPSAVNRLHVWDGTTLRRSGIEIGTTTPPTAVDSGGSGTMAVTRYGRVRFVTMSGDVPQTRSEPSESHMHTPGGGRESIDWHRPVQPGDGETHWEIELSTDNVLFYRMARYPLATTTHVDRVLVPPGYADTGVLSEDIGDYQAPWSARYLSADEDRLVFGGSFFDEVLASTVGWGPVFNAFGVGNDERMESDTDPTLSLDTTKNGQITGISPPALGAIWVTKQSAIYRLTRSGKRTRAYDADKYSDTLGALHGSLVSGLDELGRPCLYALDHDEGPYRIGVGGIMRCGEDMRATWQQLNVNANAVAVSVLYRSASRQVEWNLATGESNTPDTAIVLHVDHARTGADGIRKGWSLWTGTPAQALSMCLYAENVDEDGPRSLRLMPLLGLIGDGLVHQGDVGDDDNGESYHARLVTKPLWLSSPLHQCEITRAELIGKGSDGAAVTVACVRDFGKETTKTVLSVPLTPEGTETEVIRKLDQFIGAEMHVFQIRIEDVGTPLRRTPSPRTHVGAIWNVDRFSAVVVPGQE